MTRRRLPWLVPLAMLASACSPGTSGDDDVQPLPEQSAESANALMAEAERAAGNAARRSETDSPPARSANETVNEELP